MDIVPDLSYVFLAELEGSAIAKKYIYYIKIFFYKGYIIFFFYRHQGSTNSIALYLYSDNKGSGYRKYV